MSGDYSRHRFSPRNHYSGVRMQQGRVQLDADWNEWNDAIDRRTRTETVDTFGVTLSTDISGVAVVSPQTPDAFLIQASGGDLTIGPGRMYVDGLLAENFGDPEGSQAFDPVLAELHGENAIAYDKQPYHPDPASLPATGTHMVYLEVWQRELTHLQQPDLVEVAIGVDTTTRSQTLWQVRLLENIDGSITCTSPDADLGAAWDAVISPSAGRLSSRDGGEASDTDPCELPPSGGYRGLENQLYRIEIHEGGDVGTANFKWSRDNASVSASVAEIVSPTELKLASLGRDAVLRFNSDDWVEIIDDWRELSGEDGDPTRRIGEIRKIVVDDAKQTISFSPALPANLIPSGGGDDTLEKRHLRVIRWDQKGVVRDHDNNVIVDLDAPGSDGLIPIPAPGVWVNLENGVQVQFSRDPSTGEFHCNDYWNVAARTADASVEALTDEPPQGIHRHYARLARVTFPDGEDDCREHWPPDCGGGCCTVTVYPGDDIQAAINSLPDEGGCICLKTGLHEIRVPLEIHASNITFQGESPGTIVRAVDSLPYLLEIGRADLNVNDIEITGIRFEVTEQPGASAVSLLYLNHCAEVRITQCELDVLVETPAAYIGIFMQHVRDVVVTANQLNNLYDGIWVSDYLDKLVIEQNHIAGISIMMLGSQFSYGEYGIRVENDFVTPCRIENNQIDHFWWSVLLGDGARGSAVLNNRFLRLGEPPNPQTMPTTMDELRAYLDAQYFAIQIEAEDCRVDGNVIDLTSSNWGGIRTRAEHTLIANNTLRASSKAGLFNPLPGSIYLEGLMDVGNTADHSQLINNTLHGPQTGIIVSRSDEVTVADNFADGMSSGWFGARVADSNNVRIRGNTFQDVFFGILLSGGLGNQLHDNHLTQCGMGISSLSENNLDVSNNDLVACLMSGIMLEVIATARVNENRLINCGYSGMTSIGIAVFAEHILTESESMVRIEDNDVQDTGVNPFTHTGGDNASLSIAAMCASCEISHNHTNYSQMVLDPALEHRALLLVGPLGLRYHLSNMTIELMVGSAVVTDNRFRGPGHSYLVEFFPVIINDFLDYRFEKVTFNNNICEHLSAEAQDDTATVRLWGRNLIAMGNHVKANSGVNSMSLGNRHRVALMGNITTGDYIRVGTTTPAPLTDFNIRT
jgi:parallel beta-helix repeat protein